MSGLRHVSRRRLLRSLRWRQLFLEPLEDRRVLTTFTVNSSGDEPDWIPGDGQALTLSKTTTLRAAIMEANASVGKDTIEFNIPGAGPHVIKPATRLPVIFDAITIDGYSQPGASPTSLTLQQGNNAVIQIELDGSLLPLGTNGLEIFGGQSEVRGLAIHSFYGRPIPQQEFLGTTIVAENGIGIWLWAGGHSQIVGNFLGATAAGVLPTNSAPADAVNAGIMVGSPENVIQENVVVGNRSAGIILGSKIGDTLATTVRGNMIYGNYIGVGQDGTTPLPNHSGVLVCWGAAGNEIGGGSTNFGNVISGNAGVGVSVLGVGPEDTFYGGNRIQRNLIGTDRTGLVIDPDKKPGSGDETGNRHAGIQIDRSPSNIIGGVAADAGNTISGNSVGILIVEPQSQSTQVLHNKIGTDVYGALALPNKINGVQIQRASQIEIVGNLISGNSGTGIFVEGPNAAAIKIEDNLIGTDVTGTKRLGNGTGGIDIINASENVVQNNTISGSPNFGIGVTIFGVEATHNTVTENQIGTDSAGLKGLGNTGMGVAIVDGSSNTISANTIAGNDLDGVLIRGLTAKHNKVLANLIGIDSTGKVALPNRGAGIHIDGAPENAIGDDPLESGNVISGNVQEGIKIEGNDARKNYVLNNYIGTDRDGHGAGLGNALGVLIENGAENRIGGVAMGHEMGNIIAGNLGDGVRIQNTEETLFPVTLDNYVQANWIGVDANLAPLPNRGAGVRIINAAGTIVGQQPNTTTGEIDDRKDGDGRKDGNVISANLGDGVRVEGPYAHRNAIRGNTIYDNKLLGINLVGGREVVRKPVDGVTPNDDDDSDDGPNHLVNFPVGVTAWYDGIVNKTYISGVLSAAHPEQAMVDVYVNSSVDPTGFGEGRIYVSSATPNESGVFHLTYTGWLSQPFLSATATDGGGRGSTSEFSPVYGDTIQKDVVDMDHDGLPDEWETKGIDFNGDGVIDLELQTQYGASLLHKDVFVEFDYLEQNRPLDAALELVKTAFVSAPVTNPDSRSGIALHVNRVADADPIPHVPILEMEYVAGADNDFYDVKKRYFGNISDRLDPNRHNILGARELIFHYCLFANAQGDGSSGVGELLGDDLMVSLGTGNLAHLGGKTAAEAATFMHELGHNLGLDHGGPYSRSTAPDTQAGVNFKPNYLSVMNYSFTFLGNVSRRPLDYSRLDATELAQLNEEKLREGLGIMGGKVVPLLGFLPNHWPFTFFAIPDDVGDVTSVKNVPSMGPIDWNQSGAINAGEVTVSINEDPEGSAAFEYDILESREDWNHLIFHFRAEKDNYQGRGPSLVEPDPEQNLEALWLLAQVSDLDQDGWTDATDNAPFLPNPDQTDSDGDGVGDAGELASLTLERTSVPGGGSIVGTLTLLTPAPPEGGWVTLAVSDLAAAAVSSELIVPPGACTTTFTITTSPLVTDNALVTISADYYGAGMTAEFTVGPPLPNADLEVIQTDTPDPVGVGGNLAYTITVTNHGPTAATGIVLTDLLPADTELVSVSSTRTLPPPENQPLKIRFDYSYDWSWFFDTDDKKDLLELAAQLVLSDIQDNLSAIRPSGDNTWTAVFANPATGEDVETPHLTVDANELVIFVGARDLGSSGTGLLEGGEGVIGGAYAEGTSEFVATVASRGESPGSVDIGPWGGSIAFTTNPPVQFHFGVDTVDLDPDELDFLTVAMHELYHVLGFGTSGAWEANIEWDVDLWDRAFVGNWARDEYDLSGDVPLDSGHVHWSTGTTEEGAHVLMEPVIALGARKLPTRLDVAALADIGWGDAPLSTQVLLSYVHAAGSVTFDVGALSPGQSVEATVVVMPTAEGVVTNRVTVSGDGVDPDLANNTFDISTQVLPCPPLVVNTMQDRDDRISDGEVTSLREAIRLANLLPGKDTISFDIPGVSSMAWLTVYSPLPTITDPVVIDATTQPGFTGTPVVSLSGPYGYAGFNGLHITAGDSLVRGLSISSFGFLKYATEGSITRHNGILLENGGGNVIEGNVLGGNETAGIVLINSDGNRIGGTPPEARNVIAGNYNWGILVYDSHQNVIQGNFIGTDPTGQQAVGNGVGITLAVADQNQIGGSELGAGNVISGNRGVGIEISMNSLFTNASHNRIEGNLIGTAADGVSPLGNGSHGISLWLGNHENMVGGRDPAARNTIAFNGGAGVLYSGSNAHTQIIGNSIHSNAGLGIDRWPTGVTDNPVYYWTHNTPAFPALRYALSDADTTQIRGTLRSIPDTAFELDFYSSVAPDPSGNGEGQQWLGTATVTTNDLGVANFFVSLPIAVPAGRFLTATSTGEVCTSEFSNAVVVQADRDRDGVADADEDAGPHSGDGNLDGTTDSTQPHVATLPNTDDGQFVTLTTLPDAPLYGVWAIDNPSPANSPYAIPFPLGFFDGVVENVDVGGSTTVTVLLPSGTVPHSFYQFGATAGGTYDSWYEFAYDGTTGAEIFPDRVVLHYVDGGRGDHDLAADGQIAFRGGVSDPPGMRVVTVTPAQHIFLASNDTNVSVTFADDIDPATVLDQTLVVHAAQSGTLLVPPNAISVDRATALLDPVGTFHPGELVQVTATRGIQNTNGESPLAPFVWQFRTAVGEGTGDFARTSETFIYPQTSTMAVGDLDGDSDLDVFAASGTRDPNLVWLNDGYGVFNDSGQRLGTPTGVAGQVAGAVGVALGDLDGDGDLDAVTSEGSYTRLWLNDGHADFGETGQALGDGSRASQVALGDLDGDGDLDVFAAGGEGNAGSILWLNDGLGQFTRVPVAMGWSSRQIVLCDVDGDDDLDAFVVKLATFYTPSEANEVWLNDGQGQFTDSGQRIVSPQSQAAALGDVDGDGDWDVVLANLDADNQIWLNDGHGVFTYSGQSLGDGGLNVTLADFDGDDDLDAVFTTHVDGQGGLWLNDGHGQFQAAQQGGTHLELPTTAAGLAAGDLDADGDLDLLAANCNAFGRGFDGAALLVNNGSGAFAEDTHLQRFLFSGTVGSFHWNSQFGDVDGDGDLDVVFGAYQRSQVWLNDGQGHFRDSGEWLESGMTTLGDLDGDGDLDILVVSAATSNNTIHVWLNDGRGRFHDTGEQGAVPYSPTHVRLGDLDGDGDLDVVIVVSYSGRRSEIWLNDGQGRLTKSAQTLGTGLTHAFDVILADVDNDGDLDAYQANWGDSMTVGSRATVLLNDGQGRFSDSGQRLGFPQEVTWGTKLADFDGDGDIDAITSFIRYEWLWVGWSQSWVEVYRGHDIWLNDGNGHFATSGQRLIPEWAGAYERYDAIPTEVGDIDGDGDLDVVMFASNFCQRWLNDGQGHFTDAGRVFSDGWGTSDNTQDVSLGDVDADGDLDALRVDILWLNLNPEQINHPPTVEQDGFTVEQGTPLNVVAPGVLANDTEPDNEPLTAVLVVEPGRAKSFEFHADGSFVYVPYPDYSGPDSFEYEAVDPSGLVARAVVSIFVVPGDAAPTAQDDFVTTAQSLPVYIEVLANDRDRQGMLDPETLVLLSLPTHGRVSLDLRSGVATFSPQPDFVGRDTFSYQITGATGLHDSATVTIEVLPGNQPPVAVDDSATTDEDVPVVIDVLANDSDAEDGLDPTTVTIVAPPAHGLVQVDAQSGAVTYTPETDFFGEDRFVYAVSDTQGATARAVVDVSVQPVSDPPVATDDLAQTDQNMPVVVDVLANDSDADGDLDPTSVTVVEPTQHGLVAVDPDTGAITYTPASGFVGLDTFVYRVLDTTEQAATATVRIEVQPTSSPPDAADDAAETPEDTPVSIDVAANDTDADGDLDPSSVRILVGPLQGSAQVDPDTGHIVFTPAADVVGNEPLWYEIRDARGQSDIGLVHITVTPVNDPPVADDDVAIILKDTPTDLYILSNDTDADSVLDLTTLQIDTDPASGAVAIQADGSVRYTPHTGFIGTDTFRYTVADDAGLRSDVATVTITVEAEPTVLVVGRTFEDLDAAGPGLAGPGIAGYTVYLLDGQGALVATTHTQADDPNTSEDETGWYHFPDLPPGTYVVAEKRVAGWWQSYPADQGIQLAEPPVNPGLYVVTLSESSDVEVLDFGNYRSGEAGYASIAGRVYVDVDNDGICDPPEMGLPNVPITIAGPVTRVVLTDASGAYRADGLPPGVYTISETQPLVFQDGRDTIGTPVLGTLENDRFVDVELQPEMVAENYDFGEYGLKVQFIGKYLLLASTPPASLYVANLLVERGESLLLLETPAAGMLRASASSEGEPPAIQLYDYQWRPVSFMSQDGTLRVPAASGDEYLVYVGAPSTATISAALETAPPPTPVYVYTNTQRAHDVNADGYVSPLDALLLINGLNKGGARSLEGVNLGAHYLDVNEDDYLSPLDALLVINALNRTDGGGEGEGALAECLAERNGTAPPLEEILDDLCGLTEEPDRQSE